LILEEKDRFMLVTDIVRHAGKRYGEREAIVCGKHRLTYDTLIERSSRLVSGFLKMGLRPQDRIAIIAQNCHRAVELYIVAALSGFVAVPVKVQYSVDEIQEMLQNTSPSLILANVSDEEKVREAASTLSHVQFVWWDDDAHEHPYTYTTGGGEYEWLISRNDPYEISSVPGEDALFALLYTTGSTAQEKAVMVTQRTQVETVLSEFSELCFPVGTYVQSGSLLFSSGAGMVVQAMLTGGKQILLNGVHTNPEHILQTIEMEHADGARYQPQLVHSRTIDSYNLSSLRYIIQGGYHLNPSHFHMFVERFGPILIHGYGSTEAGAIASLIPEEYWHNGVLDDVYIRSCGRALPGVTIRVVDADGNPVPPGVVGEVLVHTRALTPGYWRNLVATKDAIRDGWLHTHDLGFLDEKSYLFLLPRNENPAGIPTFQAIDIDAVLCRHPTVADSATFSRPTSDGQRHIVAVVELHADATVKEEELITFCHHKLPEQDIPTTVHITDHMPRNTAGKVLRRTLRERYLRDDLTNHARSQSSR